MHDVIVVGGGFAGVTAAREAALRGRSVLLLEARERLGGRTWTAPWNGVAIEYGGGWVHWHQPHTWSEITRAGLRVALSDDPDVASWYVGDERRSGAIAERDAIANRGWDSLRRRRRRRRCPPRTIRCSRSTARALRPTDDRRAHRRARPLERGARRARGPSSSRSRTARSRTPAPSSVLRWHALSGYSLALTQYTGGRVTLAGRHPRAARRRSPTAAPFAARALDAGRRDRADAASASRSTTRAGETLAARVGDRRRPAQHARPRSSSTRRSRTASAGRSRSARPRAGSRSSSAPAARPSSQNAIRAGHPFGYLDTEMLLDDGTQILIGFGRDADVCDAERPRVACSAQLDDILPGLRGASTRPPTTGSPTSSRAGTWAIHRPGWYTRHHAEMQRPEGRVLLAGSDLANGWAGFIDGAIESGLTAAARARAAARLTRACGRRRPRATAPASPGDHRVELDQLEVELEQRLADARARRATTAARSTRRAAARAGQQRRAAQPPQRALDARREAGSGTIATSSSSSVQHAAQPEHERRHDARRGARRRSARRPGAAIRSTSTAPPVPRRHAARAPVVRRRSPRRRCAGRARAPPTLAPCAGRAAARASARPRRRAPPAPRARRPRRRRAVPRRPRRRARAAAPSPRARRASAAPAPRARGAARRRRSPAAPPGRRRARRIAARRAHARAQPRDGGDAGLREAPRRRVVEQLGQRRADHRRRRARPRRRARSPRAPPRHDSSTAPSSPGSWS